MNRVVRLTTLVWMAFTLGCATVPQAGKPTLVLLPPYASPGLAPSLARNFADAAGQALGWSGRYAVRTKGLFESGFDEVLAEPGYPHSAILEDGQGQILAETLRVEAFGLTDVISDPLARVYRLHFRVVDAATGFVRERVSATLPWKSDPVDAWRRLVSRPGHPEVLTPPRPGRSESWYSWWSLVPPLSPEARRWKAGLDAARAEGNYDEALRFADLILDTTGLTGLVQPVPELQKTMAQEGDWIRGDAPWLRRFLTREGLRAREDQDVEKLLAALSAAPGTPAEEHLFLPRFLDLVRQTQLSSHAAARDEVLARFRDRFDQELPTVLRRPPLVAVEGGTFRMGSDQGEADEKPEHEVTVGSFLMGRTEVTQEQYFDVMGVNPSLFNQGEAAPRRPVERVSWYDAVEFCIRLSVEEGLEPVYTVQKRTPVVGSPIRSAEVTEDRTKNGYRLPTEAEWEWAARGGVSGRGTLLAGGDDPGTVAWTDGTQGPGPVASKQANELGLFDLSGNVWEWCGDWYGTYPAAASTSPSGPPAGILKVGRGGSWHAAAWNARVTSRSYDSPGSRGANIGFRVVRTVRS